MWDKEEAKTQPGMFRFNSLLGQEPENTTEEKPTGTREANHINGVGIYGAGWKERSYELEAQLAQKDEILDAMEKMSCDLKAQLARKDEMLDAMAEVKLATLKDSLQVELAVGGVSEKASHPSRHLGTFFFLLFVLVPLVVLGISLCFGSLLAYIEDVDGRDLTGVGHAIRKGQASNITCSENGGCGPRCAVDDARHALRCCSSHPVNNFSNEWCADVWQDTPSCDMFTYRQAELICLLSGGRICTAEEVERDCVRGPGCNFDLRMIWTSDACAVAATEVFGSWYIGFLYVVSSLCSLGTPLTGAVPASQIGTLVDLYIALFDVAIAGFFIGVFGDLDSLSSLVNVYESKFVWHGKQHLGTAAAFFLVVIVPSISLLVAVICGGLLASFQGWPFDEGFLYVASNISGLANPLTNASVDTQNAAAVVMDLFVSTMALGVSGAVIGSMGNLGGVNQFVVWVNSWGERHDTPNKAPDESIRPSEAEIIGVGVVI